MRLAAGAPAARLAAPARLLGQRPGQHLLHVAEPGRRRAAPGQQLPRGQAPEIVLVCFHHTRVCRCQAPQSTTFGSHGSACRAPASPSADSRRGSGGSPRSVHACGSVICPLTPPEHTNTVSAPRRLTKRTSSRCPFSGWNGCVTTTKPEGSLDDAALCRLRRNPERARAPRDAFGISTALTGGGKYVPDDIRFQIL